MVRDYVKQRADQTTPEYREKKRVRDEKYRNKLIGTTMEERELRKASNKILRVRLKEERHERFIQKKKLYKYRKDYKNDKCCHECGYSRHPEILCFHHLNPEEKLYELSKGISIQKWLEEIKKCVLLCPNCHMEVHKIL